MRGYRAAMRGYRAAMTSAEAIGSENIEKS
jgi:hypothetical protein